MPGALLAAGLLGTAAISTTSALPATAGTLYVADVAQAAGIYEQNLSFSSNPADYDGDGDTDLLVVDHNQGAKLWRNNGDGTFTRVAQTAWPAVSNGFRIDRHDCAWGDVNRDGLKDAYCTVGRTKANHVKNQYNDNELWMQGPAGSFTDVGTEWGLGDATGRGRSATFINVNDDGYPDLFVGNEVPRSTDTDGGGENKLFLNVQGQGFQAAPTYGVNEIVGAQCARVLDYDKDGYQDLFVCGSGGKVRLYHNEAGLAFTDVTASLGIAPTAYSDADFADLNHDATVDLVSIRKNNVTYQLFQNGRFSPPRVIRTLTAGRSLALGDADGDGFIDVYALQGSATANPTDYIMLNKNLNFSTALPVPDSASGHGDTVGAIDYNGDGVMDFNALNGFQSAGPVQLLTVRTGP